MMATDDTLTSNALKLSLTAIVYLNGGIDSDKSWLQVQPFTIRGHASILSSSY